MMLAAERARSPTTGRAVSTQRSPRFSDRSAIAIAIVATLALRLAFIALVPDTDADSYAHQSIARELMRDPTNLAAHWVWLPGFHYFEWALLHVGIGLGGVRVLNALLQCAAPVLVYALARIGRPQPDRTPLLAALIAALAALPNQIAALGLGETAFTLLVLGATLTLVTPLGAPGGRRALGRGLLGGALLALACMLRYEAWIAAMVVALFGVRARVRRDPAATSLVVAAALAVFASIAWVTLRWVRYAHDPLGFLSQTRAFTVAHLGETSPPDALHWAKDLLRYPVTLPLLTFGAAAIALPFGLRRFATRTPPLVTWLAATLLLFIEVSWLRRASLGLERHYVVLVPFASIAVAEGASALAVRSTPKALSWLGRERVLIALLALWTGGFLAVRGALWHARWPERRAAAAYVDANVHEGTVLCDDPTIEVTTSLPIDRFWREPVGEISLARARERRALDGSLWVVTWEARLGELRAACDEVARFPAAQPSDGTAVVVMRLR